MWGWRVRKRSPDNILGELKELKKLGVRNFIFHSDTFTLDKKWTIDLCKKMVDERLDMRWMANGRVDTVDKEILRWMKNAGCWMIAYGFESGSQAVLDNAKKGITINQIRDAAKWTEEAGIRIWGYFIIGLPGETKETIEETIKLSKELPIYIANFGVGAPYPGTEFYKLAMENGWLTSTNWEDFDQNYSAIISFENLSSDEIIEGIRRAYKAWYTRPKQMIRLLTSVRNLKELRVLSEVGTKHLKMVYGYDK